MGLQRLAPGKVPVASILGDYDDGRVIVSRGRRNLCTCPRRNSVNSERIKPKRAKGGENWVRCSFCEHVRTVWPMRAGKTSVAWPAGASYLCILPVPACYLSISLPTLRFSPQLQHPTRRSSTDPTTTTTPTIDTQHGFAHKSCPRRTAKRHQRLVHYPPGGPPATLPPRTRHQGCSSPASISTHLASYPPPSCAPRACDKRSLGALAVWSAPVAHGVDSC